MKTTVSGLVVVLIGVIIGSVVGTQRAHQEAAINLYSEKLAELKHQQYERTAQAKDTAKAIAAQTKAQMEAIERQQVENRLQAEASKRSNEKLRLEREKEQRKRAGREANQQMIFSAQQRLSEPKELLGKLNRREHHAEATSRVAWVILLGKMRKTLAAKIHDAEEALQGLRDVGTFNDDGEPIIDAKESARRTARFDAAYKSLADTVAKIERELAP